MGIIQCDILLVGSCAANRSNLVEIAVFKIVANSKCKMKHNHFVAFLIYIFSSNLYAYPITSILVNIRIRLM